MALRGKKPQAIEKRCKLLMFGPAGVGKTTAAIQFPAPYLIDTERGAENDQYVRMLASKGGAIFQTSDYDEMVQEVTSLLAEKHEYRTLIIDPLTVVYNDLLEKSADKLATKDDDGTTFGRHKNRADRHIKRLLNLVMRLDMNVIITSHAKTKWEKNGKELVDAGLTFDCYAKLDYLVDLSLLIDKRGKDRIAIVKKTRVETFKDGETFVFNYDEFATRYGRDVLERGAVAQVLASEDQVAEIERLVKLLKIDEEQQEKWLDKGQADQWGELSAEHAAAVLSHLNKKLGGKEGVA